VVDVPPDVVDDPATVLAVDVAPEGSVGEPPVGLRR
jgi:hypothetical protein